MSTTPNSDSPPIIRVMLVDDSAVVRGLISRALQKHPQIEIIATASDGDMAISVLKRNQVDVILLDIEMPKKDGLEALPILKSLSPCAHIIMVSSLTSRNAEISLKALDLGATDYLAKPTSQGNGEALDIFYHELSEKVLSLGEAAQEKRNIIEPEVAIAPLTPPRIATSLQEASLSAFIPRAIGIASSTGGPQALIELFTSIPASVLKNVPVFITQHMPPTFTTLLADHISKDAKMTCREAENGETVQNGVIYLAPGNYHMCIQKIGDECEIQINQDPPVNFCRPAADPMLESLAECYNNGLLCMVLTGMGNDGAQGASAVKNAGGSVIIQDKESCVVWGMPGATAALDVHDSIQTIQEMSQTVQRMLGRSA